MHVMLLEVVLWSAQRMSPGGALVIWPKSVTEMASTGTL